MGMEGPGRVGSPRGGSGGSGVSRESLGAGVEGLG